MPPATPARPDATLAALYKAILAAPHDDLPRLVYADRLEELGGHARAEFIRLQIHVANTKPWDEGHADALVRSRVLYDRHAEAWGIKDLTRELMRSKAVTPGVFDPFVRGFPEVAWVDMSLRSASFRKGLKKYPVRELNLEGGLPSAVDQLGELIAEIAPSRVNLDWTSANVFRALVDGPPLPSVRSITLSRALDSADVLVVGEFAASGNFPNVETVRFADEADEAHLHTFIHWLRWPKVRDVYLHGEFTPRVQAALAAAPWLERVDTLSLEHHPAGDVDLADQPAAELTPLFRSERLKNLRSLSLDSFPFPPDVERAFAQSSLGPLDHFDIDGWCDPPVSDSAGMVSSPALANVKSLTLPLAETKVREIARAVGRNGELRQLNWGRFGDGSPRATFAELATSPASQSLRRLRLSHTDLDDEAVVILLSGRPWPNLAGMVCDYATSSGRAVAKLIDHPHFARLTYLDLPGGKSAGELWKALAKSKTVGRFHKLRLGFAITDAQLNAVLDNPEVCKVGRLVLPSRVKVGRTTQRRYEKVFGVRITWDW